MTWDMIFLVGVLFTVGTYLLLSRILTQSVMGLILFSNAVNVLLLASSKNSSLATAPILESGGGLPSVDPLPQALILTAIVIGFGLLSYFVVLVYKVFKYSDTEDLEELFKNIEEEW